MESDVRRLDALYLVLRRFVARMMCVAVDIKIAGMDALNDAAYPASLRVPTHMIANLEVVPHRHFARNLPRQFADALRQYSRHRSCAQSSAHNNTKFAYLTFTPSAGFKACKMKRVAKCGFRLVEALVAEVESHVSDPLMPALLQAIAMLIYHRAPGLLRYGHS
uniref:Uncharacterized protein n=1 Tax=Rhizobium rhizogenes TaxID=359 RepID=A0A7S4ZU74_RHIRH|nr:hypothetical protein pC5.8a_196 [Rhizobium rhizogenes]